MNPLHKSLLKELWKLIPQNIFTCEQHTEKGIHFAAKFVGNIFYNKQKFSSDEVQKKYCRMFLKKGNGQKKNVKYIECKSHVG